MFVLPDLWHGNVPPSERYVRRGSEYHKVSQKMCDEMDNLLKLLSPEAKKQLELVSKLKDDMMLLSEEDTFIYGFRLGASMILDVIGTYQGQFRYFQESQ